MKSSIEMCLVLQCIFVVIVAVPSMAMSLSIDPNGELDGDFRTLDASDSKFMEHISSF